MERSCEKQPKSRKFDLSVTMQLQEESEFIILATQDMPAINNITLPGKTFWMNCTSFSILFTVFFLCIERSLTPYYTVKVSFWKTFSTLEAVSGLNGWLFMLIIDCEKQAWLMDLIVPSTNVIADTLGGGGWGGDLVSLSEGPKWRGTREKNIGLSPNIWNNPTLSF